MIENSHSLVSKIHQMIINHDNTLQPAALAVKLGTMEFLMGMGMIWNDYSSFHQFWQNYICSQWNVSNICSTTSFPSSIGQWGSKETTCEFQRWI